MDHRRFSDTNGLACSKGFPGEAPLCRSESSLSSENPYATIQDLPVLPSKPSSEGGYMEMKCPARQEAGPCEAPEHSPQGEPEEGNGACGAEAPFPAPNHYDSPKNSHIPSHYDIPPVRHYPPSPPLRRQDR